MNFIEQFANYHVGAWLIGDGVTSSHIPKSKNISGKVSRKGKIAAAALVVAAAATASSVASVFYSGGSLDTLNPARVRGDHTERNAGEFEKNINAIISQMNIPIEALAPETFSWAQLAVLKKDDFSGNSVRQWAESLTGMHRQKTV